MRICFLARTPFDKYSTTVFNYLRDKYDSSLQGCFITSNKEESDYVEGCIQDAVIWETSDYLRKNWNDFTLEKLTYFEKKYNCEPIWRYIYTDRFLVKRDYGYVVKITCGMFSFFEEVFENNKIDVYYSECIATLQCFIAYIVGKKYGVRYIAQMNARGNLDSTWHYFVKEEFQYNYKLDLNSSKEEFTNEEWDNAEKYLVDFEAKDSPPPAMADVRTKPKIDRQFLLAPLRFIKYRFNKNSNDPYSYMYYKNYWNCFDPIIFYIRYQLSKKYYNEPDFRRKYVYLPLHYQPEASTLVCAEKYEKQLYFIDSWAKSLPADTVLYVKEHYALLGHRELSFYKELKKYPNVKLINPWVNSRLLTENAVALAALTGTAGWEAMLLRKPVFVCGNAVYETAPGIIKVNDIFDNYINNLKNWKRPTRNDIIKFLCGWFRSLNKGNAYAQNFPELLDDNLDLLCTSLYLELEKNKS